MKRWIAASLLLVLPVAVRADLTANFDNVALPAAGYNDNPASGHFADSVGNVYNNKQSSYGSYNYWSGGFAVSKLTDISGLTTSPDYNFEYTTIAGGGSHGDTNFAIGSTGGPPGSAIINLTPGAAPVSIDITNTAYAYSSMKYGDSFVNPFTASDYFTLTINGLDATGHSVGAAVNFNLATGTDIVNTWKTVDLRTLSGANSLVFSLAGSQNNSFGLLIPAFFDADRLVTTAAVPEPASLGLVIIGWGGMMLRRRLRGRGRGGNLRA